MNARVPGGCCEGVVGAGTGSVASERAVQKPQRLSRTTPSDCFVPNGSEIQIDRIAIASSAHAELTKTTRKMRRREELMTRRVAQHSTNEDSELRDSTSARVLPSRVSHLIRRCD